MKKYVCIDIGGTAIKYGLIEEDGRILKRSETPTKAWEGGPAILERAKALVRQLLGEDSAGICISTAGMVDPKKGEIIYSAPLIPDYAGIRFKEEMERCFGVPCEVENDVNCACLAEYCSGAGIGADPMLMLTVGTGIGGGLITGGRIFHGFGNSACEFGYMHMQNSDFQTLGAASVLSRKVAERKREPLEQWSGRRIFALAKEGDPLCQEAIDEMADTLGLGIANICYVVSPQTVVLGGGIMAQEEYLKGRIWSAVERYLLEFLSSRINLEFAVHGNDAGMLGAMYHFQNCRR
ncbi:MAG: ROK family protein [Lachnospiraceae bacterium]|nr:ROK family protein [Lachnospiraceae bacterium]MCI9135467.1 ROK family protein [Lachnospiraceae bacterium]